MKKGTSKRLTREQLAELKALAALPDSAIDRSDAPEVLDWSGAKRGLFYRPVKKQLTLRLDADVVAWFKRHTSSAEGYQTRINRASCRGRQTGGGDFGLEIALIAHLGSISPRCQQMLACSTESLRSRLAPDSERLRRGPCGTLNNGN
jgi:uncharacterized protein (DUF4415 family)